ncbi:MAG TPA: glycoside hydrolase family 88 protein [Treponemataceae bacterium]|nr:glycoside hydrolase family 88 protein [Treponemataceae bacterium]
MISHSELDTAFQYALKQVKKNIALFKGRCQNHTSVNNFYEPCDNNQWTCGFWPGQLWLCYEYSKEKIFIDAAGHLVESFLHRIENKIEVDHHDMGFLYTPSCTASWMLSNNTDAKKAALLASDQLLLRFQPKGGFLQAWGEMGKKENYRFIIDCLMNTPLLFWAAEETGRSNYADIAVTHIETCMKYSIREDGSTYHTFFMDSETGLPSHGATCQGYKDDSFWARGQAWAVYGTALAYRYTKNPAYLEKFKKVVSFYESKLPEDFIPYWDMIFTEGNTEPRDSSSAAIVSCGLLEMASILEQEGRTLLDDPGDAKKVLNEADRYKASAQRMVESLIKNYAVKDEDVSNGIVLHGTYSKKSPYNTCTPEGVDECTTWGDYFYLEALTRLNKPEWKSYW